MSTRERNQIENKLNLDFLERDEKFWQEKLERLSKLMTISDEKSNSDENETETSHSPETFNIRCKCGACLTSRNLIVAIHGESKAYNDLWSKLRGIISSYYTLLKNEEEVAVVEQKYENLLKESYGIKWSSDGSFDLKKNIHASLGNLTTTSEQSSNQQIQTFIVVFNMLYTRDPHQLFELLCLQLTSIVLSYKEGVKELTKCVDENGTEYYKPEDFINHILDGYDTITNIAKTLSPLVSEMSSHLEKFALDWIVMNQCMYFRFLYHDDVENLMAECILRLKDAIDFEKYKSFVYRFLKFDEKMNRIGKTWEKALISLEKYRKSAHELLRSERISMVRKMFDKLHNTEMEVVECESKSLMASPLDWIVSSEDDDFWIGVLYDIKQEQSDREVIKSTANQNCKCWACLMAEGSSVRKEKCFNIDESVGQTDERVVEGEVYHISWAVFKNLENRVSYPKTSFDPCLFCIFKHPACSKIECQVAFSLVVGFFPFEYTKYLLQHYQPNDSEKREEFLSEKHLHGSESGGDLSMNDVDFWQDEEDEQDDPAKRCNFASALAEKYLIDKKLKRPPRNVIISYFHALFHIEDDDICMDPGWLEKINKGQLLKYDGSKDQSVNKSKQAFELDGLEMSLKDLKLTAEISADANEDNLEAVVQMSMREVAQKLSTLSFDDDENTRNVLENEMKKPIVEALKLAASNKKLEAELKSLQKEHNMLKNMVKGLEQIHEEKKDILNDAATKSHHHPHPHPHPHPAADTESSKGGDGGSGCVCYYCSLFGKNQEISARSAETRDRLRKRLHHLQNQKEPSKVKNLKNIGLRLKSESKCSELGECTHNKPVSNPPPVPTLPAKQPPKPIQQKPIPQNPAPKVAQIRPEQMKQQYVMVKRIEKPPPAFEMKPQQPKLQQPALNNDHDNLNNLLEFIEGPSSRAVEEIRRKEEIAAKKQLKKMKQLESKNRKQIDEHLLEVKKFNNILQDNAIELKQSQHRQAQLKSAKSKNQDPKRIKAAEAKVAEVKAKREKLENDVKTIFENILELSPSFDLTRECLELKNVLTVLHPNGVPQIQPQKPKVVPPEPRKVVEQPPPPVQIIQQQQLPKPRQPAAPVQQVRIPNSTEEDPAKRMVTIRRINLPHAEPQVTVTAKGSSNDMDQLLYTFVNGQLVPASSLPKDAFQNGSIQLFTSDGISTKKNAVEINNKQPKAKKSAPARVITPEIDEEKIKAMRREEKKRKKEEKKQQKLLEQQKKDEAKKLALERNKKLKEEKKKQEAKEEMRQRRSKKRLIDPEFAKNPFMLLDDEGVSSSEEEEVSALTDEEQDVDTMSNASDHKAVVSKDQQKKSAQKNGPKQQPKKQSNDRKDSLASVASISSGSSKGAQQQAKKLQQVTPPIENSHPMQEFIQARHPSIKVQSHHPVSSASLMDQLSRGIKVEGLRLPPGITLTKVPPSELMNSKRESISRITQPLSEAINPPNMMMNQNFGNPNDLYMMQSAPMAESAAAKKKNKKKRNKIDENQQQQHANSQDRIVTLKNPMFFANNNSAPTNNGEPINSMMRNLQTPPFVLPAGDQHHASIIKNDNGMYTIRNPTFHQSGFVGNPNSSSSSFGMKQQSASDNSQFYEPQNDNLQSTKCNSVIGSEMKRKKEQESFAYGMDPYYGQQQQQQQQYNMHQQRLHQQSSQYHQFGNASCDRNTMECENYDSGTYPIINLEDLRSGQMLNSEVSVHNVKESKIFQNSLKRSPQNMFGDIMNSRPIPNANVVATSEPINGNGDSCWLNANKSSLHHLLTEDYEKRQNSSNSNSPISVTSLEEIYDSDSKHQKLPSFYSNHHYHHHDDKSSGASSLFSSGI